LATNKKVIVLKKKCIYNIDTN